MGCGYVCPVCEGRGFLEDGAPCDYCNPSKPNAALSVDTEKTILSVEVSSEFESEV